MSLPSSDAGIPDRSIDSVDVLVSKFANHKDLVSSDIRADPILAALAAQQAIVLSPPHPPPRVKGSTTPASRPPPPRPPVFKARPAPIATRAEGLGPRMTKAAALRQGIEWEDPRQGEGERKQVDYANVPGHKRANLSINVKSLAAPAMAPKPTKASQLRAGESTTASNLTVTRRHREEMAAANKAKDKEEQARRRASVAPVASLGAPQIAPRGNRSSELRLGAPETDPSVPARSQSVLAKSRVGNAGKKKARPASVVGQVKSLGVPSITPLMNKSAMLGAPSTAGTTLTTKTTRQSKPATPSSAPTTLAAASSSAPSRPSRPVSTVGSTPKPTRASILRANLGAKVLSDRA